MRLSSLSAVVKRHLRQALSSAIQWEGSLADAHHVAYPKKFTGSEDKVVPPEYRAIVARCKRRIAAYRVLLAELREPRSRSPKGSK